MDTVAAHTSQQQAFAEVWRWFLRKAGEPRLRRFRFGLPLLAVVALAGLPRVPCHSPDPP
ncbi:hypothetical protein FHX82_000459 [Amycolatopsis bartoniae]|uniref:Uncharacterized protein n=1 Tax=Amycolatopsis bartoniae TaxID=941986 RepID=A0A8H9ITT2_9PSEU|nr:hypothetical protein [Amycolatopsis bartoniae]GHF59460.1 hypothetical protein GCM10017566_36270 [Amycolatopsis bartoniae]